MEKDTREFILQKTFILLLDKGYDRVSISDIQHETNMSRGLLYHYFGNKDELFREATTKYLVLCFDIDLNAIIGYTLPEMVTYMLKKYKAICDHSWFDGTIPSSVTIANYDFLIYKTMQENPAFGDVFNVVWDKERIAWKIAIQNSIERKELRTDIDSEVVAKSIQCLIDGSWLQTVIRQEHIEWPLQLQEILSTYIKLLYC